MMRPIEVRGFRWLPRGIAERFWPKVQKTDGCWLWTASKNKLGYGQFTVRHGFPPMPAHRMSYLLTYGSLPEAPLVLDHLCRNPSCVRPDHLEPVTQRENIMRGLSVAAQNAVKTHCPQGHPYDAANTSQSYGRHCRACKRERQAVYNHATNHTYPTCGVMISRRAASCNAHKRTRWQKAAT